jgi:hypothetical protein
MFAGRWRAVVFASSSRLDLKIIVGPEKPDHINTILSGHLPIFVDYWHLYLPWKITASAIWRMRAALRHRSRVREIAIRGWDHVFYGIFIRAANYHFPALESLALFFPCSHEADSDIPVTFLRGPDQSDLRLRRLGLFGASLASISGLLLAATALTDLTLDLISNAATFDSSQGSFLLTCLQGMPCLRSLDLTVARPYDHRGFQSQRPTPKDIVPLLKLTRFHYSGPTTILNEIMSGLSAPSLQDVGFRVVLGFETPLLFLSRVIDDVKEEFRSVSVTFDIHDFHLLSSTHSGKLDRFKPSFRLNVNCSLYSIHSFNRKPSMKSAMVEELALNFPRSNMTNRREISFLREFLRQFRSVRVLRVNSFVRTAGLCLQQDDGEAILPVLEEVELSVLRLRRYSDEEYQRRVAEALAAFEPCERAGRLVNACHYEQT